MKKYMVFLKRTKINEFEVEAKNKNEAIDSVVNILNESSLLENPIINQVQTDVLLVAKKINKNNIKKSNVWIKKLHNRKKVIEFVFL